MNILFVDPPNDNKNNMNHCDNALFEMQSTVMYMYTYMYMYVYIPLTYMYMCTSVMAPTIYAQTMKHFRDLTLMLK